MIVAEIMPLKSDLEDGQYYLEVRTVELHLSCLCYIIHYVSTDQ